MYGYRSNRVHFEPSPGGEVFIRRTRSVNQGRRRSRSRTRSAERIHTLFDEPNIDMQGRERAASREGYDQLYRENHILKLQIRDLEEDNKQKRAWAEKLQRENQELHRSIDSTSDSEARRNTKLREARKKNAVLEVENSNLTTRVRDLTRQLKDALESKTRFVGTEIEALKQQVQDWRRRYEDANRRIDRMRENLDEHIAANQAMQVERDTLRRENDRLRRRYQ
ncbi:hypothetical protein QBC35DRAFT_40843 [Podospora australis]|uniref:Uncharacterized protein n=1 Tax=Podospora australis TaxID=1536484 RepID=A0AAN6WMM9_9PEZI|nr:hypothetical protein QBC35DRAFT_40843 [Podospora australis]